MLRKCLSGIYLLTAISVGLGAFGHGSQWSRHILPALKGVAPDVVSVLALVWFWVSGAMFAFGVLLVLAWWRGGRGEPRLAYVDYVPWVVGAFYLVEGMYGGIYLAPFFFLFAVQAVLIFGTTWALRALTTRTR